MKLVYPAIFYPCEEKTGYTVVVPDLPGCVSEGGNLADAILMGTDAAAGWVLGELEDGNSVPSASDPATLNPEANGIINLLVLDMDSYAEKYGDTAPVADTNDSNSSTVYFRMSSKFICCRHYILCHNISRSYITRLSALTSK